MIGRIYVATESFQCQFGGSTLVVNKGDTAREGHPLLERFRVYFTPQKVKYEHLPPVQKRGPGRPPKR